MLGSTKHGEFARFPQKASGDQCQTDPTVLTKNRAASLRQKSVAKFSVPEPGRMLLPLLG